jgi:hypothetical protein
MTKWVYIVEDDDVTCDMCLDFLDLVVDDEDLDVTPPFHVNCRCDIEEVDTEKANFARDLEASPDKQREKAYGHAALKNNAFKTGQIFGDDHPYFDEGEEIDPDFQ